jgi:C1A family cysteine protease
LSDFEKKDIDYAFLSKKVDKLITNYRSEYESDALEFLKGLADILDILENQTEINRLKGPTIELLEKLSVPIRASGDFVFTFKTSFIIHNASVSEFYFKGEKINLKNLFTLGEKFGSLAAKVYYDGKYDNKALFPIDESNLRNLQSEPTYSKKEYSMFIGKSIFDIRKKFGMGNPNHSKKDKILQKKLKVKVIENSSNKTLIYLDANSLNYDFRTNFPKCSLPVRDQGDCGSCWAQSAAGAIEKRICSMTSSEINKRLSPQYLVNCSKEDLGCQGGGLFGSWSHLQNNGITTEECTPYLAKDDTCLDTCKNNLPFDLIKTVPGTIFLIKNDVQAIKNAIVNQGPVQNTFVEMYRDFFYYGSGIYKTNKEQFLGYHAMQIVGWGEDHWIVENSWGTGWGENGYVRIAFGEIGVTDYVIYATPSIKKPEIICPSNCQICIKNLECQPEGCSPGFRYSLGKCVECPKNCKICTADTCPIDQCNYGFTSSTTGECVSCNLSHTNCLECNQNVCKTCAKGFIADSNGKCVLCPKYCGVCTSDICPKDRCLGGFSTDNNGQCIPCAKNCIKCNSTGCTSCNQGFIQNPNGECVNCPANCNVCTSFVCPDQECKIGFTKISGICTACTVHCLKCNEKGCEIGACKPGFTNDSTGNCKACSLNCEKCNEKVCEVCKTGFNLTNNVCEHVKCPEGCATCKDTTCGLCIEGFSLIRNTFCKKCPPNCSKCDENGLCLECNKPLFLVSGRCDTCPANCKVCKDGKCYQCNDGLVKNINGECIKCGENCKTCLTYGCSSCNQGFWNKNGVCTKCTDNCKSCDVDGCYACINGFSPFNNICLKCPDNCNKCTLEGCEDCALGYAKKKGQCKKCIENCEYCTLAKFCETCKDGFYVEKEKKKCISCPVNCLTCNKHKKCRSCPPGFRLINRNCLKI